LLQVPVDLELLLERSGGQVLELQLLHKI
jgi:hypothetical protein